MTINTESFINYHIQSYELKKISYNICGFLFQYGILFLILRTQYSKNSTFVFFMVTLLNFYSIVFIFDFTDVINLICFQTNLLNKWEKRQCFLFFCSFSSFFNLHLHQIFFRKNLDIRWETHCNNNSSNEPHGTP